jgi:predicted nucleic acid-binding protein
MQVYLDTCSLQRPLDDRSQPRIAVEAEAILGILGLCETGVINLVSSEVLQFEIDQIRNPQRKALILQILAAAHTTIQLTDIMALRAKQLELSGIKTFDALHLATAETAQVDYFCTCDDRLLKKAKSRTDLNLNTVSPLELAQEILP